MDWDKLRIFYAVAQAQSLTAAGTQLNLSQSAVSRQVAALEDALQVKLFHRHARGLLLTEQGEILFRTVADVFGKLKAAENALLESRERPRGPLVVTAPVAFGTVWLLPRLREFMELYPEITVSLIVEDAELDLSMREADCAIRLYPAKQPDLIQRKLVTLHSAIYASNNYLQVHGLPKKREDLAMHRLIAYTEGHRPPFSDIHWLLDIAGPDVRPVFRVNSVIGMMRAVEAGIGIAALPQYMTRGVKGISAVLEQQRGPETDVYFTYASELRNSKRIAVFRDFLVRQLNSEQF